MDAREALDGEILELQKKLRARIEARKALDRHDPKSGPGLSGRFTGMRPLNAIRKVLAEHGSSMPEKELTQILIDGGITAGRKRAAHNIRISIDVSEKAGSLIRENGNIGLPVQKP